MRMAERPEVPKENFQQPILQAPVFPKSARLSDQNLSVLFHYCLIFLLKMTDFKQVAVDQIQETDGSDRHTEFGITVLSHSMTFYVIKYLLYVNLGPCLHPFLETLPPCPCPCSPGSFSTLVSLRYFVTLIFILVLVFESHWDEGGLEDPIRLSFSTLPFIF